MGVVNADVVRRAQPSENRSGRAETGSSNPGTATARHRSFPRPVITLVPLIGKLEGAVDAISTWVIVKKATKTAAHL